MTNMEHDGDAHARAFLFWAGSRWLGRLDHHNLNDDYVRCRGVRWLAGKAVAGFMITLPIGLSIGVVNGMEEVAGEVQTFMDEYTDERAELYKACLANEVDERTRLLREGLAAEGRPIDIAGCHIQADVVQGLILRAALSRDGAQQPQ